MTFAEAYEALYRAFIVDRGLDQDDQFWADSDKATFHAAYRNLLVAYNREPL